MLETNPCWQLADGEGRWLCPFCVTLRPGIRFVARGSVTQRVVDSVATHLGEECSTYTEGKADGWPFEVLERVLNGVQPAPAPGRSPYAPMAGRSRGRPPPRSSPRASTPDAATCCRRIPPGSRAATSPSTMDPRPN